MTKKNDGRVWVEGHSYPVRFTGITENHPGIQPVFEPSYYRGAIAAALKIPEDFVYGMRTDFGILPGVESAPGVFISQWPSGRLFWPHEVIPMKRRGIQGRLENVLNWTATAPDLSGYGENVEFAGPDFNIGFWRIGDVEEPWKRWEPSVGYVEPTEWVVTYLKLL